jgi:hypothetical protein
MRCQFLSALTQFDIIFLCPSLLLSYNTLMTVQSREKPLYRPSTEQYADGTVYISVCLSVALLETESSP